MASSVSLSGDERLVQINEELSTILEEKLTFLATALKTTERLTQQIASHELDIKRNTDLQSRLEGELQGIDSDLGNLRERSETLARDHESRQREKYAAEKEIQRLEWEIADRRKSISDDLAKVSEYEREMRALDSEHGKLQKQVQGLEAQVTQMRRAREDYLARISDLKREMSDIAGGGE